MRLSFLAALLFTSCLFVFSSVALTQSTSPQGVLRLKVRYKSGTTTKELPRKRFFLIKGGLADNRKLIDLSKLTQTSSRQCDYANHGASAALIKWLDDNDCESVYCRAIEEKSLTGPDAVPEFQTAFEQARRELKDDNVARRWLTNYLPAAIRSGFYDQNQEAIQKLILSGAPDPKIPSAMTDRKGTAYFTNIEPGIYTISNLIGSEIETKSVVWACEREIKAGDLWTAKKRPLVLTTEEDPKVKCEVIQQPLNVCPK